MNHKVPVQIQDLHIGQPLTGNVVDADDKILFREGLILTEQIFEVWKRRGDGPYFLVQSTSNPGALTSSASDTNCPPEAQFKRLDEWCVATQSELEWFVAKLVADETPSMRSIEAQLDTIFELVHRDAAAIVHYVIANDYQGEEAQKIARRSVYLSALSTAVALEFGLEREDCYKVGLAAILHDIALFPALLNRLQDAFDTEEDKQSVVRRHAMMATDILTARVGIPDLVRVVINQVHEQMDGSGYPRGLPGHLINVMARIINLCDAFLTLIAVDSDQPGYIPGDAIAYLIHHTSLGTFDRDCMRAFIAVTTLYGIGTKVLLDSGQQARVIRGVAANPLQPIVACIEESGTSAETIDLSDSNLKIMGPVVDSDDRWLRMPKSKISQMLWLHPIVAGDQVNRLSAAST